MFKYLEPEVTTDLVSGISFENQLKKLKLTDFRVLGLQTTALYNEFMSYQVDCKVQCILKYK